MPWFMDEGGAPLCSGGPINLAFTQLHKYISTLCSTRLQLQMENVTMVVPDDELQFLTASFGPNATAKSGVWVSTPSAGLGRLNSVPVS